MEEQKNKGKEVKMEPVKGSDNQTGEDKQLTYEQLNNACVQLSQQNQYLRQQIEQANKLLNTFSRLDYLFKVVELANKAGQFHFEDDFVLSCYAEIQEIMTIPEEDKDSKE